MTDHDPPEGYIGVGFHVDSSVGVLMSVLDLELEPDGFDLECHEEADGRVVVVRYDDQDRSAGGDMTMDESSARQLAEGILEVLDG